MHSLTSALTSLLLLLFLAFLPHLSNSAPGYTRQDLSHLALLPPDPDLPKENIHPTDILIVTTVDGSLHAVHKPTGTVLWTKGDTWGPLVDVRDVAAEDRMNGNDEDGFGTTVPDVVARDGDGGNADVAPFVGGNLDGDEDMPRGLYIPEPTGNGDLYYYEPGKAIRKLPLPIKKIVDDNHPFMFGDYVFTGKKVNRLLAVSPLTGDVLRTFGGDGAEEGPARLPGPAETSYLYIGRTREYHLT
ncbi:uncharacterized protein EV422DRAFT_76968 [Fimicolochytrium jonesii]|uniref:uncharacterized protein n=1 Tax=Fimicolochytrium jonesii TaxID=1396493 RepID=UPI0022FEA699|nr:uncharacterized protein EV422DRAFT_76968 [Fimicolochytrium jonesii]KAI8820572.1 hypothetical protein EV422DRAFT_76968 [Fimicolochytrium jonesii]